MTRVEGGAALLFLLSDLLSGNMADAAGETGHASTFEAPEVTLSFYFIYLYIYYIYYYFYFALFCFVGS